MKLSLSITFLPTIWLAQQLQAFCIYNNSIDKVVRAFQEPFHTTASDLTIFSTEDMPPGDKKCCPYTNSDCSYRKNKQDFINLVIFVNEVSSYTISLESGGWVEIKDRKNSLQPEFVVYNSDGSHRPCLNINSKNPQEVDKPRNYDGKNYCAVFNN